jgi:hypothetical protein
MIKSACVVAALIGMNPMVAAGELLLAGRVESILLLPSGSEHCPRLSGSASNADGTQHVSISNDGGCQQASIRVSRTLLGKPQQQTITIVTRLGEWSQPSLPLQANDILIYADADAVRWSALEQKNGATFFEAQPFTSVGGVKIASLPHDGDGLVPLASLVDKFNTSAQ